MILSIIIITNVVYFDDNNIMKNNFWSRIDDATKGVYSRKSLASDIGVSVSTISMWKNRQNYPSADIAVKIAKKLGVSVEFLVTGESISDDLLLIKIRNSPQLKHLMESVSKLPDNRVLDLIKMADLWLDDETIIKKELDA